MNASWNRRSDVSNGSGGIGSMARIASCGFFSPFNVNAFGTWVPLEHVHQHSKRFRGIPSAFDNQ
jgi:hypothetical protein